MPVACRASKRLSTEDDRNAAQAGTGPMMPFEVLRSQVLKLEQIAHELPSAVRYDTLFGSATPCKRAARLGVSPTMACS